MTFNFFTLIFLCAVLGFVTTMLWLNVRQNRAIVGAAGEVPELFREKITPEDHRRAGAYTQAKLLVNHFEIIFSMFVVLVWTFGGAMNVVDDFWRSHLGDPQWVGVAFLLSVMMIAAVIDLPFSIYRHFVLEEKFGFNRMGARIFALDFFKNLMLIMVLGAPLIFLILYLMRMLDDFWWFYAWLALSLFSLLMTFIYPQFIAPLFNKFQPLEREALRDKIENMLKQSGFQSGGIFVVDGSKRSSHQNAYFTGLGKNKRIVFFDTVFEKMRDDEILAIVAHELGHFYHRHIQKRFFGFLIFSFIGFLLLGFLAEQSWFFAGLGVRPSDHAALMLFVLIAPVFVFLVEPMMNGLSRAHEFEADRFAAKLSSAENLISALVKLYRDNAAPLISDKLYSLFHDSHPSASARILHLKK